MISTNERTGYPSVDKPWLKYYSEEAINAPLPECTIYEYLYENNKDFPSDIAINYLGRKITYKDLFENIDKTAAAFLKAGVKEKEIVTVALPSIPEALYCVYALDKIGAVANMIHPLAGKEETIHYFNEVESRVAVIFDGAYGAIADDIDKTSVEKVIVASRADSLPIALKMAYNLKVKSPKLDGKIFITWKAFLQAGKGTTVKTVDKDCHEMAIISHTGGTTGEPKGVMCSDANINSLIYQTFCCFEHEERQHRALAVLPPFVNYSLVESMLEMLYLGYTVILLPKYEPEKIWDYIRNYRPNVILSIPAYWEMLLVNCDSRKEDMSFLEQIYYGGEAMNKETERAIDDVLLKCGSKTELLKGLGSTELMAAASQTYPWCNAIGSVGIPLVKTNCKVVNPETNEEMGYREDGEICFSGPTLMLGYYKKEDSTNDVIKIHEDGTRWLHTGDVGHIDTDGVIYVTGRIKRIIMTKGTDGQVTKLFPDRVEKAIFGCQNVELCCVVGVPNKERINYPKAFVVLKNKSADNSVEKEIISICKQNLPDYMIPKEIQFMDDLPRTPRGKVDYRALEEMGKEA